MGSGAVKCPGNGGFISSRAWATKINENPVADGRVPGRATQEGWLDPLYWQNVQVFVLFLFYEAAVTTLLTGRNDRVLENQESTRTVRLGRKAWQWNDPGRQ